MRENAPRNFADKVDSVDSNFVITRNEAGNYLGVSTRTIDRYITANKLSVRTKDGRKWLSKKELLEFKQARDGKSTNPKNNERLDRIDKVDTLSHSSASGQGNEPEYSRFIDFEGHVIHKKSPSSTNSERPAEIYKSLYSQLRTEMKRQQERLEAANYRVGNLEARLEHAVPLLKHTEIKLEQQKALKEEKEKISYYNKQIRILKTKIKAAKITKAIYLTLIFILLLMQPIMALLSSSQS